MTIDDWAALISNLYGLEGEVKTELTGSTVLQAILNDAAVNSTVREVASRLNTTGIFCDKYKPRGQNSSIWCLFVAPPGEQPPKPTAGTKW